MATAASSFTFGLFGESLRVYVGLASDDTSEDSNLGLWLAAASADLDELAEWYYTDPDTDELVDTTPDDPTADALIALGVFEWVKAMRAIYSSPVSGGVAMVKTGALQEAYAGGVSGLSAATHARRAAMQFWSGAFANLLRIPKAV